MSLQKVRTNHDFIFTKMHIYMFFAVLCLFMPVWLCVQQQVCVSFLALGEKVMQDDEFTCDLFRFLQLLCEGHNSGECLLDGSSFNILNHTLEITENKQLNYRSKLTKFLPSTFSSPLVFMKFYIHPKSKGRNIL